MWEASPCSLVVVRSHRWVFSCPWCVTVVYLHCRSLLSDVEVWSGIILYRVIHQMHLIGLREAPLIQCCAAFQRHRGTYWHIWIGYLLQTELRVLALPSVAWWLIPVGVHLEVIVYWQGGLGCTLVDQTLYLAGVSVVTVSVALLKLLGRLKLDRIVSLSLVDVAVQLAQLLYSWVHRHQFNKGRQSGIPEIWAAWNGQCSSLNGDLLLCLIELVMQLCKLREHLV